MEQSTGRLTLDMIQGETYRSIAEAIGVDNLVRLAELVGGSTVYIPKADSFFRPLRDIKIKEEFNGFNHVALALKYGVTERWVREICGEGRGMGQTSLFDPPPEAVLGSNSQK